MVNMVMYSPRNSLSIAPRHIASFPQRHKLLHLRFLFGRNISLGGKQLTLPLRWCELLALLAMSPQGLTGEELLDLLYGEQGNKATLKASLSKLRRYIPISSRPYHLNIQVTADFLMLKQYLQQGLIYEALSLYQHVLLPSSEAPGIMQARLKLNEALRQAALASQNASVLFTLANRFQDDLELWETGLNHMSKHDPRYPYVLAHLRQLRLELSGQ